MSSQPFYFRRRIGRAASPPTWACYEQIRYENEDYSDSDSDSCSEDDEDYVNVVSQHRSDGPPPHREADDAPATGAADGGEGRTVGRPLDHDDLELEMEMGDHSPPRVEPPQKDIKGKQRAVDPPEPEQAQMGHRGRRHARKRRQPTYTLRPILTIQRSQGFVWNQVRVSSARRSGSWLTRDIVRICLSLPTSRIDVCCYSIPHEDGVLTGSIPDIASTSPPSSKGFISASASSTNSALTDYEVEVVEIRIQEGEIYNLIS